MLFSAENKWVFEPWKDLEDTEMHVMKAKTLSRWYTGWSPLGDFLEKAWQQQ